MMTLIRCFWYDENGDPIKGGCKKRLCTYVHPWDREWSIAETSKYMTSTGSGRPRGSIDSGWPSNRDRPSSPPRRDMGRSRSHERASSPGRRYSREHSSTEKIQSSTRNFAPPAMKGTARSSSTVNDSSLDLSPFQAPSPSRRQSSSSDTGTWGRNQPTSKAKRSSGGTGAWSTDSGKSGDSKRGTNWWDSSSMTGGWGNNGGESSGWNSNNDPDRQKGSGDTRGSGSGAGGLGDSVWGNDGGAGSWDSKTSTGGWGESSTGGWGENSTGGWGENSTDGWGENSAWGNSNTSTFETGTETRNQRNNNNSAPTQNTIFSPSVKASTSTSMASSTKPTPTAPRTFRAPKASSATGSATPFPKFTNPRDPTPEHRKVTTLQDGPPSIRSKSQSDRIRETSPASTERSGYSALSHSSRRHNYQKIIRSAIILTRLRSQIRDAEDKLDTWKKVQLSRQFERVRVTGRNKLDNTRRELREVTGKLRRRIHDETKLLLAIPNISVKSEPDDVEGFLQRYRPYLAEVNVYIADLKLLKEKKLEADMNLQEEEIVVVPAQSSTDSDDELKAWQDMKARVQLLEGVIFELIDEFEEPKAVDASALLEEVMQLRVQEQIGGHAPGDPVSQVRTRIDVTCELLETRGGQVGELLVQVDKQKRALQTLDSQRERKKRLKEELVGTLEALDNWQNEWREKINQLSEEIQNLHTRSPPAIPYADFMLPHIESMVREMVQKEVTPVLAALQAQGLEAVEERRRIAFQKIEERIKPMNEMTNEIAGLARAAASKHLQ